MLILSRKIGESVVINDNITVKILEVSGDKVRIGIDAPKEVSILRNELKETAEQNKNSAAQISRGKLADFLKTKQK